MPCHPPIQQTRVGSCTPGGLVDAVVVLDQPWEATVGHWKADNPFRYRWIDRIRVTVGLLRRCAGPR